MKRDYFFMGGLMIVGVLVATLILYSHLPERVPTHWNIRGQIDGYSQKWTLLVIMPGAMASVLALFAALPWLSPRQFEVDTFRPTYLYMMLVILGLFGYMHALKLWAATGGRINITHAVMGGAGLLFALLGNVLGKVQRNFYIGIRTPWTLASERVWNATHRFAAKTFVLGGVIGLVLTFAGAGFWAFFCVVMTAALIPVVHSLVYYKRLERRGEL